MAENHLKGIKMEKQYPCIIVQNDPERERNVIYLHTTPQNYITLLELKVGTAALDAILSVASEYGKDLNIQTYIS